MKTGDTDVTKQDLPMLGGFTGVELSRGTQSAHIYTDYDPSKRKAAQPARNLQAAQVVAGRLTGQWDLSVAGTYTLGAGANAPMYDHDGDPATPPLNGDGLRHGGRRDPQPVRRLRDAPGAVAPSGTGGQGVLGHEGRLS